MAARRFTLIRCDGCNRKGMTGATAAAARKDLRRLSRSSRWKTGLPGGTDLCPECQQGAA